jgi:hypothetical protein
MSFSVVNRRTENLAPKIDWVAVTKKGNQIAIEASETVRGVGFTPRLSANLTGVVKSPTRRKEVNNNCSKKFWGGRAAHSITSGLLLAFAVLAASGIASAQDKTDEITFNLLPNPAVVDCLRANAFEEPRAHATVIRGKVNDTLILDLDGIKPA